MAPVIDASPRNVCLQKRARWAELACAFSLVTAIGACGTAVVRTATLETTPSTGSTEPSGPVNANNTTQTSNGAPQSAINPADWATGGTAIFSSGVTYADPFGSTNGTMCTASCTVTDPVCPLSNGVPPTRQDISEGQGGLPMRAMLQILGTDCNPIPNATVEIWHTSAAGEYSGHTDTSSYCNNNDPSAKAAEYFRGIQVTDGNGLVAFDSCFPGWFSGRTLLINVLVTPNNGAPTITQLFFADNIVSDIIATQPLYNNRGSRDTTNQTDPVLNAQAINGALMSVAQMPDGVMLAYKSLILELNANTQPCTLMQSTSQNANTM